MNRSLVHRLGGWMHLLMHIGCMGLLIVLLASCGIPPATNSSTPLPPSAAPLPSSSAATVPTQTTMLAKPGDTLGDVTLVTIVPAPTRYIEGMMDTCPGNENNKPGIYTVTCLTGAAPLRWLGIGWSNTTAKLLESDWSRMRWTAYLDGHELDLKSFGTFDLALSDLYVRGWNVALKDPPVRDYTLRTILEIQQDLKENDTIYPAGTYDTTFHIKLVARSK